MLLNKKYKEILEQALVELEARSKKNNDPLDKLILAILSSTTLQSAIALEQSTLAMGMTKIVCSDFAKFATTTLHAEYYDKKTNASLMDNKEYMAVIDLGPAILQVTQIVKDQDQRIKATGDALGSFLETYQAVKNMKSGSSIH